MEMHMSSNKLLWAMDDNDDKNVKVKTESVKLAYNSVVKNKY